GAKRRAQWKWCTVSAHRLRSEKQEALAPRPAGARASQNDMHVLLLLHRSHRTRGLDRCTSRAANAASIERHYKIQAGVVRCRQEKSSQDKTK
ncbi:MAG TPA: hypothetical protein VNT02_05770, partial [Burkholderiales bacterium]|nr:hypothetical protein [Burkholderiales bacterium]